MALADYEGREEKKSEGTSSKYRVYVGLYLPLSACDWAGKSDFTLLFGSSLTEQQSRSKTHPKLQAEDSFPVFLQQMTKMDLEPFPYWAQSKLQGLRISSIALYFKLKFSTEVKHLLTSDSKIILYYMSSVSIA